MLLFTIYLYHNLKHKTMTHTTSLKHYKALKAKGVNVVLVTKEEIN